MMIIDGLEYRWKMRLVPYAPEDNYEVGDVLLAHPEVQFGKDGYTQWPFWMTKKGWLSPYYFQHNSHRPPAVVIMPGMIPFTIDQVTISNGQKGDHGWTVEGEVPDFTLGPSINMVGAYHGYIKNGWISVDVEGRKFDDQGYAVRS